METDDLQNHLNALYLKLENIDSKLEQLKATEVNNNRWLFGPEVMSILRISESTLRRRRLENKIPYKKFGGNYYYPSTFFDKVILDMAKKRYGDNWAD